MDMSPDFLLCDINLISSFLWYLVFHTSNETLKGLMLGVFLIGLGIRVLITAYLGTGWQELALEEINTQDSRLRK